MKARSIEQLRQSGADTSGLSTNRKPKADPVREQVKVLRAMSDAIQKIDQKANAEVKALVVTLKALVEKMAEIQDRPKAWEFDVERGKDKLISKVKAKVV